MQHVPSQVDSGLTAPPAASDPAGPEASFARLARQVHELLVAGSSRRRPGSGAGGPAAGEESLLDPLTGLPGRAVVEGLLEHTLSQRRRLGSDVAVLHVELATGGASPEGADRDLLVVRVAERLRQAVRVSDHVGCGQAGGRPGSLGRSGGQGFVVVLTAVEDARGAARAALRVREALSPPLSEGSANVEAAVRIGIACRSTDGEDAASLLSRAEDAARRLRDLPGSGFGFHDVEVDAAVGRWLDLEERLRGARERGELSLAYQPLLDGGGEAVLGVEALLRWSPAGGPSVSPDEFIPVAEQSGLMPGLGEWVLRTACREVKGWMEAGQGPVRLSVNFSPQQVREPGVVETVAAVLAETSFPAEMLQIELTESGVIGGDAVIAGALARLRSLGVVLAIDDFGTGFSALGYLRRFPVDVLKIDRSFVTAPGDQVFVSAIIALAHRLGLRVVAEGVEANDEHAFLVAEGCDEVQGFLFSPPLKAAECRTFISARRRAPRRRRASASEGL
jgi:diguanylate cyclase (GGDEF)-like protein